MPSYYNISDKLDHNKHSVYVFNKLMEVFRDGTREGFGGWHRWHSKEVGLELHHAGKRLPDGCKE